MVTTSPASKSPAHNFHSSLESLPHLHHSSILSSHSLDLSFSFNSNAAGNVEPLAFSSVDARTRSSFSSVKSWRSRLATSVKSPAMKAVKAVKSAIMSRRNSATTPVPPPTPLRMDVAPSVSSDTSLVLSVSNSISSPRWNHQTLDSPVLLNHQPSSSSINIVHHAAFVSDYRDSDRSSTSTSMPDSEYDSDYLRHGTSVLDTHSISNSIIPPAIHPNSATLTQPLVHEVPPHHVCTPTLRALDLPHDPTSVTVTDGRLHPLPGSVQPAAPCVPEVLFTSHVDAPTSPSTPPSGNMVRRHSISSPEYHQVFHGIFGWSFQSGRPDFPPVRLVEPPLPPAAASIHVDTSDVLSTSPCAPLIPDVYGEIWRLVEQTHRTDDDDDATDINQSNIRVRRRKNVPLKIDLNQSESRAGKSKKLPIPYLLDSATTSNRSSMLEGLVVPPSGPCSDPQYIPYHHRSKCTVYNSSPPTEQHVPPLFVGKSHTSVEDVAIFMKDQRRLRRTELASLSRRPARFVADPSPLYSLVGDDKPLKRTFAESSSALKPPPFHVQPDDTACTRQQCHLADQELLLKTDVQTSPNNLRSSQSSVEFDITQDAILPIIELPCHGFHVPELETTFDVFGWALSFGGGHSDASGDELRSASPLELVRRLTEALDYEYLEDFFVVYRLFMDPLHLAKLLILRMRAALPIPSDTPDRQLIRMRTGVVLRHWFKHYFEYDFADNKKLRQYMGRALKLLTLIRELKEHEIDARTIKALKRMWISRTQKYVKSRSPSFTPVSTTFSGNPPSPRTITHESAAPAPETVQETDHGLFPSLSNSSTTSNLHIPSRHRNNPRLSQWSSATSSSHLTCTTLGMAGGNDEPSYIMENRLSVPPSVSTNSFDTYASSRQSRIAGTCVCPWMDRSSGEASPVSTLPRSLTAEDTPLSSSNPLRPARLVHAPRCSITIPVRDSAMAHSPYIYIGADSAGFETMLDHCDESSNVHAPKQVHRQDSAIQVPEVGDGPESHSVAECTESRLSLTVHAHFNLPNVADQCASISQLKEPQVLKHDKKLGLSVPSHLPPHLLLHQGMSESNGGKMSAPPSLHTVSSTVSMVSYPGDSRRTSTCASGSSEIVRQAVGKLRSMFKISALQNDSDSSNDDVFEVLLRPRLESDGQILKSRSEDTLVCAGKDVQGPEETNDLFRLSPKQMNSPSSTEPSALRKSSITIEAREACTSSAAIPVTSPASEANSNALDDAVDEAAKKYGISQFKDLPISALPNCSRISKIPWMMTIRSSEVAQHLSIVDEVVVRHVDWTELLEIAVGRHPIATQGGGSLFARNTALQSPTERRNGDSSTSHDDTVRAVIDRFNTICQWVQSQVLIMEDVTVRAKVIEKFIKIGCKCEMYHNWFTLMAIMLALQSINISRLSRTWTRVSSEKKALLDRLVNLTSPTRNFIGLRKSMEAAPGLPFAGIYFSDLLFNNEIPSTVNYQSSSISSTEAAGADWIKDTPTKDGPVSGNSTLDKGEPVAPRLIQARAQRGMHRSLIHYISLAKQLAIPTSGASTHHTESPLPHGPASAPSATNTDDHVPATKLEASHCITELEDDMTTIVNWQKYKIIAKVVRKFKTFLDSPSYDALYKWELRNEIFWHSVFLDRQVLDTNELTRRSNLYEPSNRYSCALLSP